MQLTVTTPDDQVFSLDLDGADPVSTLKAILEAETGAPAATQLLMHNGRELLDESTLTGAGLQAGDLIMLLPRAMTAAPRGTSGTAGTTAPRAASAADPTAFNEDGSAANPESLIQMFRSNPGQMQALPADVADAVRAGDVPAFQTALRRIMTQRRAAAEEEARFMRLAEEDPFNPEVQRRLEEAIQQKNVMENLEIALEHNPEAFSDVCMLYVNMEVNGFPLKAFIDSGAQMTIMSRSCASRCNLLKLMDTRYQGMAVGVGSAKILGRIHMVQLKAGSAFFPVSITVLDQDGMEFLFGLDNLKRHQCCIDLKDGLLRFGSSGASLPFLPEHEIPRKDRLDLQGVASPRPAGTSAPPAQQQQAAADGTAPTSATPAAATAPREQQQRQQALATGVPAAGVVGVPAGWEEKVQRLQALGFTRERCLQALQATGGNEELAGSMLFQF